MMTKTTTTTDRAPRPARRKPAGATRILVTGGALAGTGAMVATMALNARAAASEGVVVEPAPLPASAGTAAPAPTAPPVVVVIRWVPGAGSPGAVLRSGDRPVPAPAPSSGSSSSSRSGGS
jgi:hypothetical protein